MRIFLASIFVTFLAFSLSAQEVLLYLNENPVLKGNKTILYKSGKAQQTMPFIEDFSTYFGYPDAGKFTDSLVYISGSFAYKPFSIGVATFDGFNQYGEFYDHGSSFPFTADSLTSQNINLDSVFTGTPHLATAADSIYFSFYYQPQGLGEKPDVEDSLVLQFYAANQDVWYDVWSSEGMSMLQFQALYNADWKSVMIPITDTMYLNSNFRFRFFNYASYADLSFPSWASNADYWNIDYIFIDSDRGINDSLPEDICFRERKESMLEEHYVMPWNQFLANVAGEMAGEISVPYSNYSNALVNITERLIVTDLSGTSSTYNSGLSAANLAAYTDTSFYRSPVPYSYNSLVSENAEFLVQMCINTATISDMIAGNDTLAFYQRFYNYFASDDGTPEAGYGLSVDGAMLAYAFTLNTPDTLQSVQMYFNRVIDDANQVYFYLTIWDDDGGQPGNIIYQQQGVLPQTDTGFYNYHTYVLNNPLTLNGTFYVGWEQTSDVVLNIGFDMNSDRSDRIFFNTDGNWYNTLYEGALMIRPVMGSSPNPFVGVEENQLDYTVFPNPTTAGSRVNIGGLDETPAVISLFDLSGRLIMQAFAQSYINLPELETGMYFLSVQTESGQISSRKIIVRP
ncbi:MAG: T9SS type A sorting domain-containing protein [Bacteroidales bacterium]|nr:T9SS type A sorting domain-containing protein [Bacteroidales bacterium]